MNAGYIPVLMTKTVLIVEDDQPTQMLVKTLMERNGLRSVIAGDGAAAIEVLEKRDDIACIILDLMMPEVDGTTVISFIAKQEKKVPVIVCSAAVTSTMPSLDPTVVRAVIRKPFDIEHLAATAAALIDERS